MVCPAETLLFDLCDSLHTDGNWNPVVYFSQGIQVQNALHSNGETTTVYYECTDDFSSYSTSGAIPSIYPVNAGKDSFTLTSANNTASVVIGGLMPLSSYDFKFFGSRNAPGPRQTDITINAATQTLETAYNTDQAVEFKSVQSSQDGSITVEFALNPSSSYAYLGVMEINGDFDEIDLNIYVAPDGDDANPGTITSPLATLAGAAQRVRNFKSAYGLPEDGLNVFFREGIYCFDSNYTFDSTDSGQPGKPVVYRSYPGETARLTGTLKLDASQLTLVTSADPAWSRLDPAAQGNVMKMSLASYGITDYGNPKGYPCEIIFNEQIMQMARWPNDTYSLTAAPTGDDWFTYSGSRPERWLSAVDAYTTGHYSNGYFRSIAKVAAIDTVNKQITLAENPIDRGVGEDKGWYVFNLLEEIDMPGEYFIDKANDMLYFWPPGDTAGADILITALGDGDERLFNVSGASYLRFENLIFEGCRTRITRLSGSDLVFDGCVFRNAAGAGITGTATDSVIKNCEFYDLGKGGIGVYFCGDRKSLTPANLLITNNYITKLGRFKDGIEYTSGIGMHTSCCGITVSHNHIENTPDIGIGIGGNLHVIEYNRMRKVSMDSHDMGATYTAGNWSSPYGTLIRYNEVYDNTSELPGSYGTMGVRGIYMDFWASGATIEGNILHTLDAQAMHTAGGHSIGYSNNVIVNAPAGFNSYYFSSTECNELLDPIREMDYDVPGSAWYLNFPFLTQIPNDCEDPEFDQYRPPQNCFVEKTITYNVDNFAQGKSFDEGHFDIAADNLIGVDPGFIDENNQVFALRADSPAYEIPGFTRIPWERIGLLDTQKATRPIPLDQSSGQMQTLSLYWAPALDAASHKVYFGTDAQAVSSRNTGTFLAETADPHVLDLELDWGTTYYWLVDEYDDSMELMESGDLWTFTTAGLVYRSCDLDFDFDVDIDDLALMFFRWLEVCTPPGLCDRADVENSGKVDLFDFAVFAEKFNQPYTEFNGHFDFEAPEYLLGTIDGQDGWSGTDYSIAGSLTSGLYTGGQAVSISTHNVWLNRVSEKVSVDPSAGPVKMSVDVQVSHRSGLHIGMRAGTPDYGPAFGIDVDTADNNSLKFFYRDVAASGMGATTYGSAVSAADGDWIRITETYDTVSQQLTLTAHNLTTDTAMTTGITNVSPGAWTVTDAGMWFRHLQRISGETQVTFDNIVVSVND